LQPLAAALTAWPAPTPMRGGGTPAFETRMTS